ncbi:MAG: major facilitator superfamily 1 [Naasia sp.]|jgi:fucose permease|uniref:MFS transporter n=1 Tax=Naasia sp. TaxID=2546198 RepID=UPI00261D92CB|nr:MFS transporter [Naasia sp.]MCU1570234.1 major facilitator superfamily 1 [Naasia sp.]
MSAPALTRRQVTGWRNAVFVTFALSGFAIATWLSRVPAVRDELGVSTSTLGLVLFGIAVGSIIGLVLSSHVIAKAGTARGVLFGLGVGVLGLPVAAFGSQLGQPVLCFAGLLVFGAGSGLCDVAMNVSGAANERVIGRAIMPLFHAMFSAGTVLGVGIGALAEAWGVPVLVHVSAATAVLLVAVVVTLRWYQPEHSESSGTSAHEARTEGWRTRLAVWREPRTLLIGLIVLGMAFTEGSANDWLPLAMVDGHGLDNATGAVVLGVFLVSMTIGRVLGVFVLDRFGRVPVLRASAGLAAIGLGVIIFVPSPELAVVGAVLWGLGASLGFPVGMSAAADEPRRAAARVSAVATIGYVAFLVGPPLIGFLADQVGLLLALGVVLVLVALAGLVSHSARELPAADGAPVDSEPGGAAAVRG